MIDQPEKTRELMTALKVALPFEVELTPEVIESLHTKDAAAAVKSRQLVSEVSYAGDEGGIMCHIHPTETKSAIIISITHVRMHPKQPLAKAVYNYQKHRIKKIKKQ